jgi:hypothetical protein
MIWFTWRQFRTQAYVALVAVVAVGATLAVVGHQIADLYSGSGIVGCHPEDCANALDNFLTSISTSWLDPVINIATAVLFLTPALIGAFWGAPLISRELETGTYRLAWNQSFTRTRWLATKVIGIGLASVATVGLLSLARTWSTSRLDQESGQQFSGLNFGSHGLVPIGYAAFAFALGVTLGLLIRRTVPAMAATLAVYVAALLSMQLWVRAHLMPTSVLTESLNTGNMRGLMMSDHGQNLTVLSKDDVAGGWILSARTITPSGQAFTGPADPNYCGPNAGKGSCFDWVASLNLRQVVTYQPLNHYWPIQFIETGIFVAAALALTGFCFWWVRRRLS